MTVKQTSRLSKAVESIQPSGIRRFFDMASTMDDVVSLGVGEPDFSTPWNVCEASIASLERGHTSYTANAGLPELRREIANYMDDRFNAPYDSETEVLVTVGASEALDAATRAIVDPGDEVIIVEPTFVSYAPVVTLAGGVPVPLAVQKEDEFKLTPEALEAAITTRTKAVMICFPNNPTGAVMTESELQKIASVIERHDLLVLSDEIYAELTYDGEHTAFSNLSKMRERTVIISGFSKAFAMTGWRLGFVCGPEDIVGAMLKIHQYAMMCAPTPAQHGALEALRNGRETLERMIESYQQRRNFIVQSFRELGLDCHQPGGAFYAFPNVASSGLNGEAFAEKLLLEEQVAVVPGNVFGGGGEAHVRCSYATSLESIKVAIDRMDRLMQKI